MSICLRCKYSNTGVNGRLREICVRCFARERGGEPWDKKIKAAYARKLGRPAGTTDYSEPKALKTHRMTPAAHAFIRAHKDVIEQMARTRYELQFKMGV